MRFGVSETSRAGRKLFWDYTLGGNLDKISCVSTYLVSRLETYNITVGQTVKEWLSKTPKMTVPEVLTGIKELLRFFRTPGYVINTTIFEIADFNILYMIRHWAPPNRNLNVAIRQLIMGDGKKYHLNNHTLLVPSIVQDRHLRWMCIEFKEELKYAFLNVQFRKDCEIAFQIASGYMPIWTLGAPLPPYHVALKYAREFAKRWPIIHNYISTWNLPDTAEFYTKFLGWDEPVVRMCADIVGVAAWPVKYEFGVTPQLLRDYYDMGP